MNAKVVLILGVSIVALTGALFAFLSNASSYVNVTQAKQAKSDNLHLPGEIVPGTVEVKVLARECHFVLKDVEGHTIQVIASEIPANLAEATSVVAVGSVQNDVFHAHKLLVKCPSKYETEDADKNPANQGTEVALR